MVEEALREKQGQVSLILILCISHLPRLPSLILEAQRLHKSACEFIKCGNIYFLFAGPQTTAQLSLAKHVIVHTHQLFLQCWVKDHRHVIEGWIRKNTPYIVGAGGGDNRLLNTYNVCLGQKDKGPLRQMSKKKGSCRQQDASYQFQDERKIDLELG